METILLELLNERGENGLHGYALILLLRKKFGVYISSSTIYPELKMIEEKGLATSIWRIDGSKPRNVYRISETGQRLLQQYFVELKMMIPLLNSPIRDLAPTNFPDPIRRLLHD